MLDKLEKAVATISENSNRVAVILERHENRLNEGDKANQAIIKMINDHQRYDEKMFEQFTEKFESLEKKVDENQKMLWLVTCSAAAVVALLQLLPTIGLSLTPTAKASMMAPGNALVNEPN